MKKGKEVINEPFWTHPDDEKEIIMNTYITKQQAIDAFDNPDIDWYYGDVDPESVIRVIESIPAADVRPVVRGKWVRKVEFDGVLKREYFVYSECGQTRMLNFHNFCPNCGADMRIPVVKQVICRKCGSKRFVSHGETVVCSNCGADMRGNDG